MKDADVQRAMYELAAHLEEAGIPYAIAGAMALNAYGYERVTQDVDVLLDRQGLDAFERAYLGRGYVDREARSAAVIEKFPNSKGVRDTRNNVSFSEDLHPYVRAKFQELWQAAQVQDSEDVTG